MYWYADIESKRVVGYDPGSWGINKWTVILEIKYDNGLQFTKGNLGGLIDDILRCASKVEIELLKAVNRLLEAYPDDTKMASAFNEYLNRVPKKFYTVSRNNGINTHVVLHEDFNMVISTLKWNEESSEFITTTPFSLRHDESGKTFEYIREAVEHAANIVREKYTKELDSWDSLLAV